MAVNPAAVAAMAEEGYVTTMGCVDGCPSFPAETYLVWVPDGPAGQGVDQVRPIRDEIKSRIAGLIADTDANATMS